MYTRTFVHQYPWTPGSILTWIGVPVGTGDLPGTGTVMFGSSTIGKSRPPMSTTGEAYECSTASTAFEGTLAFSTTTPGFGSSKPEV
ncbi:unnamed protein product [Brassica oleracea]